MILVVNKFDSFNRNYCSHGDYVNNNDEIMEMMACGAVEHNMYMVVNIGEMVDCEEQEVSKIALELLMF